MGGLFIIKYKSGYVDYMTHEYFFSLDPVVKKEKLAPLRKKYRLKQLEVFCGCGDNVRMVMVYRSDTDSYFLRSADKSAHHKECVYVKGNHNFSDSSNLYQQGYVKQADGFTEIQLDGQDFKIEKKNTPIKVKKAGTTRKSLSSHKTGTSIYRPSIYAILTRFLHESWNNVIQFSHYKNAPYPKKDKKTVYNHLINRVIKGYKTNDLKLCDLLYKGEAEGKIHVIAKKHNFKSAAFAVMLLHNEGIIKAEDTYELALENPNYKKTFRNISVNKELYESAMKNINGIRGPYLVGGFVVSTGYKKMPKFISFGLVPISDYGAPVESSYERQLFNKMSEENRAIIRPASSEHPSLHGFLPDGILLDTKPKTIIEVFGMSTGVIGYHDQRRAKDKHYRTLQPAFDFWYWNAFENSTIPIFPK